MRLVVLSTLVLAMGCSAARTRSPGAGEGIAEYSAEATEPLDLTGLEAAEDSLEAGRLAVAGLLRDSLYAEGASRPRISRDAARRLARLLMARAEDLRAAELLLRVDGEPGGRERELLRAAAGRLSLTELEGLVELADANPAALTVVRTELAHTLALAGYVAASQTLALRILDAYPNSEERSAATELLEGRIAPIGAPLRIGLILPRTGRFSAVGEEILAGALVAFDEYRERGGGPEVVMEVVDDSSRSELAPVLVRQLEREGVVGVVGPIRSGALLEAAREREEVGLVIVSPTASENPGLPYNVYTLWEKAARQRAVAQSMARWMMGELGLSRFGVLYPRGGAEEGLAAFQRSVGEAGGSVVEARSYDPDSTTFAGPISALASVAPEAIFVLSSDPRTVLQLVPQLVYYGLRSAVVGGDATWADPLVVRRLDPTYANYRLVATYLDRVSTDTGWAQFQALYERKYRNALPDNVFSALGYDALRLLLDHLPRHPLPRPGIVARGLRRLESYSGATGQIAFDSRTGTLSRDVRMKMLFDRSLVDPDPTAILEWAEESRRLEEFLKELEEKKEQEKEGRRRSNSLAPETGTVPER
jgi:branched-chain amino acid transport system substrate-binding protein